MRIREIPSPRCHPPSNLVHPASTHRYFTMSIRRRQFEFFRIALACALPTGLDAQRRRVGSLVLRPETMRRSTAGSRSLIGVKCYYGACSVSRRNAAVTLAASVESRCWRPARPRELQGAAQGGLVEHVAQHPVHSSAGMRYQDSVSDALAAGEAAVLRSAWRTSPFMRASRCPSR